VKTFMEREEFDQPAVQRINQDGWDNVAARFYGVTMLPLYGPLTPTEEQLHLLDTIPDTRILEIGCGSGHSLLYLGERGAAELWGLDLSPTQIDFATSLLGKHGYQTHLFPAPMEENPGLPVDYFDMVVSIYALGWTYNLKGTLAHIFSYLKPGGSFVFSWEHPVFSCLHTEAGQLILKRSYNDEVAWLSPSWADGKPIVRHHRKLSTFLNGLIEAGFLVERVIEGDLNPALVNAADTNSWYSPERAAMMPTTFIIKARKPL
jgi:SAM-dependent methyltransferase